MSSRITARCLCALPALAIWRLAALSAVLLSCSDPPAEPAPTILCQVVPATLDFGHVIPGESIVRSFSVRNEGEGRLAGTVGEGSGDFQVISGAGDYFLDPGQSIGASVRYQPMAEGADEVMITTGSFCAGVRCRGNASQPAPCAADPESLLFGNVTVGDTSELSFVIRNDGEGVLWGEVTLACTQYEITSGGGPYEITAGQSKVVRIAFTPTRPGPATCGISLGHVGCMVTCIASGVSGALYAPPRGLH